MPGHRDPVPGLFAAAGWKLDVQGCPVAGRAEDGDCPAERRAPVFEAGDARAAAGVGAPDAVVADPEGEAAVAAVDPQLHDRGLRVLGGVGERFGRDVVGGRARLCRPGDDRRREVRLVADEPGKRTPNSPATSAATAVNTSPGGTASATSIATRLSAACSAATCFSALRASAFAMAMATSSVNAPIRSSIPAGSGPGPEEPTDITPQSRPSTTTGVPTAARTPMARARLAAGPPALA